MKEIFTKSLFLYMLIAFLFTITAIFMLQTFISRSNNRIDSQEKLEEVKEKISSNEQNIASLTESLGQNNLAKAKAFADILALDHTIENNIDRLNKIKDELMVTELHIIDENGIITGSTSSDYIGFDMKSGEQSNVFMAIVDDPSIEIVQEPQLNASKGIMMQYIGVARKDAKGLVQVGVRPEILENMLASTAMDVVLGNIDFGNKGYIYAINADGKIIAHQDTSLIGTDAVKAGFPKNLKGSGKAIIQGVKGYYMAEQYKDQMIGTFMPSSEYYEARRNQTIVVSLSMLLIFGVLLFMINQMVDHKIVNGIHNISHSMKKIAEGNFGITVKAEGNPEFELLSQSINKMVASISQNIQKNERLLEQQKEDMEKNHILIQNVKNACIDLNHVSGETLENADAIYHGTEEQDKAVEDLKQTMDQLTQELNQSASDSVNITAATNNSVEKIVQTQKQMESLKESMQKISEMSIAIEKIIGEINSIAQKTNMLSLNASVEAARAGDMGKGFSVVAVQIGELAARSAQAAKETNILITNSIDAVESGRKITDQTAEAFNIAVENIEKANQDVEKVIKIVKENAGIVIHAVEEVEKISNVVERNVQISHNTKQMSSNMADIIVKLMEMIEN